MKKKLLLLLSFFIFVFFLSYNNIAKAEITSVSLDDVNVWEGGENILYISEHYMLPTKDINMENKNDVEIIINSDFSNETNYWDYYKFTIDDNSTLNDYYNMNIDIFEYYDTEELSLSNIELYRIDPYAPQNGAVRIKEIIGGTNKTISDLIPGEYVLEIEINIRYEVKFRTEISIEKVIKEFNFVDNNDNLCDNETNICYDDYLLSNMHSIEWNSDDDPHTKVFNNNISEAKKDVETINDVNFDVYVTEGSFAMVRTEYIDENSHYIFEHPENYIKYIRYKITYRDVPLGDLLQSENGSIHPTSVEIEIISNALYKYDLKTNTLTLLDYNDPNLLQMLVSHMGSVTNSENPNDYTDTDWIKESYINYDIHDMNICPEIDYVGYIKYAASTFATVGSLTPIPIVQGIAAGVSGVVWAYDTYETVTEAIDNYKAIELYNETPYIDREEINEEDNYNHVKTDTAVLAYNNLSSDDKGDSLKLAIDIYNEYDNLSNVLTYITPILIYDNDTNSYHEIKHFINFEYNNNLNIVPDLYVPTEHLVLDMNSARNYNYLSGVYDGNYNGSNTVFSYVIRDLTTFNVISKSNLIPAKYEVTIIAKNLAGTSTKTIYLDVKFDSITIPRGMRASRDYLLNDVPTNLYEDYKININYDVAGTYQIQFVYRDDCVVTREVKVISSGHLGTIDGDGLLESTFNVNTGGEYTFNISTDMIIVAFFNWYEYELNYDIRFEYYNESIGHWETIHYGDSMWETYITPEYTYRLTIICTGNPSPTDLSIDFLAV